MRCPLLIALLLTMLTASTVVAQETATIDGSGEKVLLKKDGTWSPVKKVGDEAGTTPRSDAEAPQKKRFEWRGLKWGMSKKKVMRILRRDKNSTYMKDVEKEENLEKFITSIGSDDYVFAVGFHKGVLNRLILVRAEKELNNARHFEALNQVVESISEDYGELNGGLQWSNDLYRDDTSGWGTALTMDHVSAFYVVETRVSTRIAVMLEGGMTPRLMVLYSDTSNETPDGPSGF